MSRDRVCKAMVNNPIYSGSGPVYESVQPRPNPELGVAAKLSGGAANGPQYETLRDDKTARYVMGRSLSQQAGLGTQTDQTNTLPGMNS